MHVGLRARPTPSCPRPNQNQPNPTTNPKPPQNKNTHRYAVADFLSAAECDALMHSADGFLIRAPVVGAGNGELSGRFVCVGGLMWVWWGVVR